MGFSHQFPTDSHDAAQGTAALDYSANKDLTPAGPAVHHHSTLPLLSC